MNADKTLFAQVMEFIPCNCFTRIVHRYNADSGVRRLNCAEQFRIMAFAQDRVKRFLCITLILVLNILG